MTTAAKGTTREAAAPDDRLVKDCLNGNQDAWSALVDRYRNLIYSIPLKYGLSHEDCRDIFQQVCLQLLESLPTLREPKSLASWLIKVTAHTCFHWVEQQRRYKPIDVESDAGEFLIGFEKPHNILREVEQEQILREALLEIAPRCRELIRLLFLETPSVPYEQVAKNLGLARGSIGFIRMRCLKNLRRRLAMRGFLHYEPADKSSS